MRNQMNVSILGTGNAGFRLAISLKSAGISISAVVNRSIDSARQLSSILNKPEYNPHKLADTPFSCDHLIMDGSDIIFVSVSDDSLVQVLQTLKVIPSVISGHTTVCHISGATSLDVLSEFPSYGVFFPMMTLSKNKPVDMKIVPFLLEASDSEALNKLTTICRLMSSEFSVSDSSERLKMHVATVFVSDFFNYLAALSYDIASNHHVYLLPQAIETVRKAFLYGDPAKMQTGPSSRGDITTIEKHLEVLKEMKEHYFVYEMLSNFIVEQTKIHKKG